MITSDMDGYRCEAAMEAGAITDEDVEFFTFSEAQLIVFAKMCERKGRAEASRLVKHWGWPTVASYMERFVDATDEQIAAEIGAAA